jgi:hypothetical protein
MRSLSSSSLIPATITSSGEGYFPLSTWLSINFSGWRQLKVSQLQGNFDDFRHNPVSLSLRLRWFYCNCQNRSKQQPAGIWRSLWQYRFWIDKLGWYFCLWPIQRFNPCLVFSLNSLTASPTNWQGFRAVFDNLPNYGRVYHLWISLPCC